MPGFTTHYLFGLNAYRELGCCDLKKTIQNHHAAYSLGLQGPDLFFYFLPSYTIRKHNIGSIAHTECTGRFLRHLLDSRKLFQGKPGAGLETQPVPRGTGHTAPKSEELQIAEAYIAGFLGHYILDTQCHPYIYWKTDFQEKSNRYYGKHMGLETDIDKELLMHYKNRLPSAFRQDATIAVTKQEAQAVAKILSYVYRKTYPRLGVFYITMHAAIRSIQLGTRFFHDPTGRKKKVAESIEKVVFGHPMLSTMIPSDTLEGHADPLNRKKRKWKNPWDETLVSQDSFFDMMEKAQERYLTILGELGKVYGAGGFPFTEGEKKAQKRLLDMLGNVSYHSGLDAGIPS